MSVPFIIGTLIDTIYSSGGASSGFTSIIDTISQSSPEVITNSVEEDLKVSSDNSNSFADNNNYNLDKFCAALAGVFLLGGAANAGRVYLMTTAG